MVSKTTQKCRKSNDTVRCLFSHDSTRDLGGVPVWLYTKLNVLHSVAPINRTGYPSRKRTTPRRVTGSIKYGLNALFSVASVNQTG